MPTVCLTSFFRLQHLQSAPPNCIRWEVTSKVELQGLAQGGITGEGIVAQLSFSALPGLGSTFVNLAVSDVSAIQADGQPISSAASADGRIAYLDQEPLLEIAQTDQNIQLVLFGSPGVTYSVESSLSLTLPLSWVQAWESTLTNLMAIYSVHPTNQGGLFRVIKR